MELENFFPIWDKLTASQQERIRSTSILHSVRGGTMLHNGGPDCLGLLLVKSGQLRAYMLSEEGREVTISRFFEMDMCLFSASCVMSNMLFDVFIEAEKDSEVWVIPACLYQNLMEESLPLASYSRDLITNHFSEVMWLMEQVMWRSFDKRLAAFLVEESRIEETTMLRITHEKIAAHLGTAREVVTRMLRWFQSDGKVKLTRGTVEITDLKALEALSDG